VSYITLTQLRQHAQIGDNLDDAQLEDALNAAVGQVDDYCRRTFTSQPQQRMYRRGRPVRRLLWIDDVIEVEAVEVNGSEWPEDRWELWPYNAAADGKPYTALEPAAFGLMVGRIVVTGIFGWPQIPPAVRQATLLQASRLAQRRNAAFGIAQVPGFDGNTGMRLLSKLDADVELLLDPYRRRPVLAS